MKTDGMTSSGSTGWGLALVFAAVVAVYGLSVHTREAGYALWLEHPETYFAGDVTAMATMDSYHWLKMARDLDAGYLGKGLGSPTKGYPDQLEYHDANLLAWLISVVAGFTNGDYYRAGLVLVSVLGGLFIFPLFYFFHRLGFGAAAVLGGLMGDYSYAYYQRTAMGFVDTDLLNLFFPLMTACFILPLVRQGSMPRTLILAAAAGLSMYLFNWWYEQPGIFLVYLVFIAACLLLSRLPWRQVFAAIAVFSLCSGPAYVLQSAGSIKTFWQAYMAPAAAGGIVWPDVMFLISEAQQPGALAALKSVHGHVPLVIAGLVGLVYLYIRHWREMLLVTPLLLFGLWSLFGPIRFAMYLAPLVGVGVGVLIMLLIRHGVPVLGRRSDAAALIAVLVSAGLFYFTSTKTAFAWQPKPILAESVTKALVDIKKLVPRHSAMVAWWDMGYPLMEIGDFATYHDGSLHGGLRSTLIGKALASSRQEEMVSLLAYLEDHGFESLQHRIDQGELTAGALENLVFSYPGDFRGEQVYLLYTDDMIRKFGSITEFGMWDFARRTSDWVFYERWDCMPRMGNLFKCREGVADLARGVITDGVVDVPLNAVVFVNNGAISERYEYRTDARYYLQVLLKDQRLLQVQVVDARLYETNFNQQYVLGNFDPDLFEEVYNNFPVARLFKVRNR